MKFIEKFDKFCKKIVGVERNLGALMVLIMLIIVFGSVIMRYVFRSPIIWSEEIVLILLVVFGYTCISIDVYKDTHVCMDLIYKHFPMKVRHICDLIKHVLTNMFLIFMAYYDLKIIKVKIGKPLPATGFSQGLVFILHFVIVVLMILFCTFNLIKSIVYFKVANDRDKEIDAQ